MMDTIQEEAKFVLETFPKLAGREGFQPLHIVQ